MFSKRPFVETRSDVVVNLDANVIWSCLADIAFSAEDTLHGRNRTVIKYKGYCNVNIAKYPLARIQCCTCYSLA